MFDFFKPSSDRSLTATYAFCLCMALTLGSTYFAYRSSEMENAARFDRAVSSMSSALQHRMNIYINALLYTRNLFDVKPSLTDEDFGTFVRGMRLQDHFPGIQTMGYIERLTRKQAEARLKSMGLPLKHAQMVEGSDEIDLVVFFEKIFEIGSTVYGVDLGTSDERKMAMNKARDLGVPVATDRVLPMDNSEDGPIYAFLVFLPRYRAGADLSQVEGRRAALQGFVYAGFRTSHLFGRVSTDTRTMNANLLRRVYDGDRLDPKRLMFTEGDFSNADPALTRTVKFEAANHSWLVELAAPRGFGLAYVRWSPLFVFTIGISLSFAVMASLVRSDRLAQRLKFALEEADRANQAKSMFLANISHEIRTPLGVIMGFAESALSEPQKERKENFLRTILRNGNELARILGDVLDLSKIEAKALMIENGAFSLKELHAEILEAWSIHARDKGLKFNFSGLDSTPEFIRSDRVRIKQILVNLLSNAFKFTSQGGVDVAVEAKGNWLVYTVDDTGIGIREENWNKLFRAFSQEDSSITRKFGGSGLGLAISKELALALGGDLFVQPHPNLVGSRFVFQLPLSVAGAPDRSIHLGVNNDRVLEGKKILLVEDSKDNQDLIELMLEKQGSDLSIANNGAEGVTKALGASFDLILMDIQMPVMDGYAAFEKLKHSGSQVPVIALTAHALKDEKEKALRMGFSAYLTKPIDRTQLIAASAEALS